MYLQQFYHSPEGMLHCFISPLTTFIINDVSFTQVGAKGLVSLIIGKTWRTIMQDDAVKKYTLSLNQTTTDNSAMISLINESVNSYLTMLGKKKQDIIDKIIENYKKNKCIVSDPTFETIFKKALILTFINLKNLHPNESGTCQHPPCLPRLSSISDNLREKVSKRKLMPPQKNYNQCNCFATKFTNIKTRILESIKHLSPSRKINLGR